MLSCLRQGYVYEGEELMWSVNEQGDQTLTCLVLTQFSFDMILCR
jgi:hypothetical protein